MFPLQVGGTDPLGGSHGYKDATDNENQIYRWWGNGVRYNVAIACGAGWGPTILDVDGPSGEDLLRELESRHGRLPPTLCATSGRANRRHIYLASNGVEIKRSLKIAEGYDLDVLGIGGYVIAPPSVKTKRLKRGGERTYTYRWLNDLEPAPVPPWLRFAVSHNGAKKTASPLPEVIQEGERDKLLTSLAGSMRRRNASPDAILAALLEENALRCRPPLPDLQIRKIAKSVGSYKAPPLELIGGINDLSLAYHFEKIAAADVRYCPHWKRWLYWDGARWARDYTHEAQRCVEGMVRRLIDGSDGSTIKELSKFLTNRKLKDIAERSSFRSDLVVTPEVLDADAYFFNVQNGTIDLETGLLNPHEPKDDITKMTPVRYERKARAPRWDKFLSEISENDSALIDFLQRAVGYTMIGEVKDHILFFCHGPTGTGKSTFLEIILEMFGDYGVTIDFEVLLHSRLGLSSEAHRSLPRLHKARFVAANESPPNARWNEAFVKQLTGGDTLSGRWLYQETFDFQPSHTLWCRANEKPTSYDTSDALWRRMKLTPFEHVVMPEKQNADLREELRAEMSGILNWAIEGALRWQGKRRRRSRGFLELPERVERATREYHDETDAVGIFIEDRCRLDYGWTPTSGLYSAFEMWWITENGTSRRPMSKNMFTDRLKRVPEIKARKKKTGGRGWSGIVLK